MWRLMPLHATTWQSLLGTLLSETGGRVIVNGTFHVFLLLGQSNMVGFPQAREGDRVVDPRIRVLDLEHGASTWDQTYVWRHAAPPLHDRDQPAIGPGDYFARTLLPRLSGLDTIGLVPCAINGEKIATFLKWGGTKYSWIVARAKAAQRAGGVIRGMLFHQGESDAGDDRWPARVSALVADLRTDLELSDVPFLAGELAHWGSSKAHNRLVNQLPRAIPNAYVVSAHDLEVDPTDTHFNVHFDYASQVELGRRYAATMIEALGL